MKTKKIVLTFTIMLLLLLFCRFSLADTTLTFEAISATCSLNDAYIVLTPDNLSQHLEWITNAGTTVEALQEDFASRGVLCQAWDKAKEFCCEITAVQDDEATRYFDLDQQTKAIRNTYRSEHLKGEKYKNEGYKIQSAEWKTSSLNGKFLQLKYKRTVGEETYRGYARRTIRNGYTITIDLQVFGRALKNTDKTRLDKIMGGWSFTQINKLSGDNVEGIVTFEEAPPAETNTGKFTLSGTCLPGLHMIGAAIRMSSTESVLFETDSTPKGKFSMDVALPEEGVWLMTVTVENSTGILQEIPFDITTYQSTLLPVNFSSEIPDSISTDELVIEGKTIKGVSVQCIVSGADTYNKQIRTNGNGTFRFKLDTSKEGEYDIVLVFQKKAMTIRRFTYKAVRAFTEEDVRRHTKATAVKPSYSTLKKKIAGYTGKVLTYNAYVTDIQQSGDEWIIFTALKSSKKKGYSNMIVLISPEQPEYETGSQHRFYGTCSGNYQVQSEESNEVYPCCDLLFWEN